ncbi:hypothetical protein PO78_1608 [Thauera sp. SWB20]|nr:hypothetical protein PO78_1608 [Thauera sp. SWB20]
MPGAEVVDRDAEARAREVVEVAGGERHVLHQAGFGDLELERRGRHAAGLDLGDEALGEVRLHELLGRYVDRHAEYVGDAPRLAPAPQRGERGAHDPAADREDLAAGLGDGDELGGRNASVGAAVPTQQGLDADDVAAAQLHLGLVHQRELVAPDRAAQGLADAVAALHPRLELGLVGLPLPLACGQRERRHAHELLRAALVRLGGDADAQTEVQPHVFDLDRRAEAGEQPLGERAGRAPRRSTVAQQDPLRAVPHREEALRDAFAQPPRCRARELVGHAEAVQARNLVHALDRQEEHRGVTPRRQPCTELVEQRQPVGQAGERIVARARDEFLRAFGDQRFEQFRAFGALLHQALHVQDVADALQHLDLVEGLGEEIARAEFERAVTGGIVDLRGEDDDRRRLRAARRQPLHELEAVQVRHAHIEQDEVGRVLRHPRRHPARVGDAFETQVARVFEQGEQQLDVGGVVVDDQDVGVGLHGDAISHRCSCVRGSARGARRGQERRRVWSRSR